jgi:hypothetical protein
VKADTAKARRAYAQAVGEVALSWNDLHFGFCVLMGPILADEKNIVFAGIELWNAPRNDDLARSLLAIALKFRWKGSAIHKRGLLWALEKADRLAAFRNDAMHTPIGFEGSNYVPLVLTTELSRQKRARFVNKEYYRVVAADLRALARYVGFIVYEYAHQESEPLHPSLRRPQLQLARLIERSPPPQPRARRAKRKRQPHS